VLRYSAWNENGTEAFSGTEGELIVANDNSIEISDLSEGATYDFIVKAVTTAGESDFSMGLMFRTKFDTNGFDDARAEVFGAINEIKDTVSTETSFCAHREVTNENAIINYDAILFLNNNTVSGASMDVSSGMFTAGSSGRYKVAVGLEMQSDSSQEHRVWVEKNGSRLEETLLHYSHDINAFGSGWDNGSREFILSLNAEETVNLYHETNAPQGKSIMSVTFCVSSIEFE